MYEHTFDGGGGESFVEKEQGCGGEEICEDF